MMRMLWVAMGMYVPTGGWKKICADFFSYPSPSPGVPPKKKLAPHVGIFLTKVYAVNLSLNWARGWEEGTS